MFSFMKEMAPKVEYKSPLQGMQPNTPNPIGISQFNKMGQNSILASRMSNTIFEFISQSMKKLTDFDSTFKVAGVNKNPMLKKPAPVITPFEDNDSQSTAAKDPPTNLKKRKRGRPRKEVVPIKKKPRPEPSELLKPFINSMQNPKATRIKT